jgi:hypothetical protein
VPNLCKAISLAIMLMPITASISGAVTYPYKLHQEQNIHSHQVGWDKPFDKGGPLSVDKPVDKGGPLSIDKPLDKGGGLSIDKPLDKGGGLSIDKPLDKGG